MASDTIMPPTTVLGALNSNCPALGSKMFYGGSWYRFAQHVNAVTVVAGHVALFTAANVTGSIVTNDTAGGATAALTGKCAGIYVSVPTAGQYVFIQTSGICLVLGDGSVAAGEFVVPDTDGVADTMAAGEEMNVFGYALDADSTSNDPLGVSALFHCLMEGTS